jgi:hypothetical protein
MPAYHTTSLSAQNFLNLVVKNFELAQVNTLRIYR